MSLATLATITFATTLATFAGAFQVWAPKLYDEYRSLAQHYLLDRSAQQNFPGIAFAAATFNLGPATVNIPHINAGNLPHGWCAITAFGDFDPDFGGHLILWDLGLVIRFPPGHTILIPSGCVCHSNVGIRPDERRYPMVLYSAGGLFRYKEYGMKTMPEAMEEDREKYEAFQAYRESLRPRDFHLFSKYVQLVAEFRKE